MRKRGRPKGSTSWHNNPVAWAANHLNVLIEMWLGGVPIRIAPDRWLVPPTTRRYTVPPKTKRELAVFAAEHIKQLTAIRPDIDAVIAWARRNPPRPSLRRKR